MIPESEIGKKIRSLRKSKKMTLEFLANQSGYSKGYLSKVENSDKSPPVSTLMNIASALRVGISDIFGESQALSGLTLMRKAERQVMAGDGTRFGYAYEPLVQNYPGNQMHPYVLTVPAGSHRDTFFEHAGEEMLLVLEGRMRFLHGNHEYLLEEGDCIYFDGSFPHRGYTHNCDQAKCLIVLYRHQLGE